MYIVKRKDKLFVHYGLYISNNMVFHYASLTNNMFAYDQHVRITSLKDFSMNRKLVFYKIDNKININEVFRRADVFSKNGKTYNVFDNNCISFILSVLNDKSCISFIEMVKWIIKFSFRMDKNVDIN